MKDSKWWGSLGVDGAAEFHTLTPAKRHVSMREFLVLWNDLSHPIVATEVGTFADWKANQEKLCSWMPGRCKYEDVQKMAKFFWKMRNYQIAFYEMPSPFLDPDPAPDLN